MEGDNDGETIRSFVRLNPYPSYQEMMERIDRRLDLYAEYGSNNHICCKIIYETHPGNKDLIVEMGKVICKMGGKQALVKNLEVIKSYSPFCESNDPVVKTYGCVVIEGYFKDIIYPKEE